MDEMYNNENNSSFENQDGAYRGQYQQPSVQDQLQYQYQQPGGRSGRADDAGRVADHHADYADSLREYYYGLCVGLRRQGKEEQVQLFQGMADFHGDCDCALYHSSGGVWRGYGCFL